MNRTRNRWLAPLLLLAAVSLGLAACGSDSDGASTSDGGDGGTQTDVTAPVDTGDGTKVSLVPQDFGESKTLTEVYGQYLEARGYDVEIQKANGFRELVYPALDDKSADVVIDYTGSAASYLDETGTPSPDSDETYTRLQDALGDNLEAGAYSPAADQNALVVLKSFAEENNLTKISDLKAIEDQVTLGGSAQCAERDDCLLGYQSEDFYGLQFKDFTTLEYGPPLAAGLESGDIQAAQYQTTAPEIASGDFVVLEDDKGLLSADNIVPIVRTEAADGSKLIEDLDALSAMLTTDDLIEWNNSTDIEKEEPTDVATAWLEEKGLI